MDDYRSGFLDQFILGKTIRDPLAQAKITGVIEPVFSLQLLPVSLPTHMLCVGIMNANRTIIYYNENRDIPDAPKKS